MLHIITPVCVSDSKSEHTLFTLKVIYGRFLDILLAFKEHLTYISFSICYFIAISYYSRMPGRPLSHLGRCDAITIMTTLGNNENKRKQYCSSLFWMSRRLDWTLSHADTYGTFYRARERTGR